MFGSKIEYTTGNFNLSSKYETQTGYYSINSKVTVAVRIKLFVYQRCSACLSAGRAVFDRFFILLL